MNGTVGALLVAALQVAALGAEPTPADPQRVAASRAQADAILARAGVADLFENTTSGLALELRHRASGFTCRFDPGQRNFVMIYPGLPRGDDVQCRSPMAHAVVDTFVTRPPRARSLQQAFDGYAAAVRQAHPDAVAYTGSHAEAQVGAKGVPPHLTARMTYGAGGRTVFSRLSVAVVDGWLVEQRLDAPLDTAFASDLLGDIAFVSETTDMAAHARAPTQTATAS